VGYILPYFFSCTRAPLTAMCDVETYKMSG
jgi:hypothetical protein